MKFQFERMNLNAGYNYFIKYRKGAVQLEEEERQFRSIYHAYKKQEKVAQEMQDVINLLQKKVDEFNRAEKGKVIVLKKIGGEAKKHGWKNKFREVKAFARQMLKGKKKK